MCGGLAYMELAWIGDALRGPSTLLNVFIVLQRFRTLAAPARKSQLCSTSLATRSTLPQLQIENPNFVAHKSSTRSALPQRGPWRANFKTFRIPLGRNADATHRHVRTQAQTHLGFCSGQASFKNPLRLNL